MLLRDPDEFSAYTVFKDEARRELYDYNWLTPRAEVRRVGKKGWGSFAKVSISKGETVAVFGGCVITSAELATLNDDRQHRSIQIDNDLYMVSGGAPERGDMINHSCAPNCGLRGSQIVSAMRDIEIGEELTFDYAMCDASEYDEFQCLCGTPECRKIVTGADWKNPDIQEKYAGWFSPYIQSLINSTRH
jgi:SET domain-containing protein